MTPAEALEYYDNPS